MILDINNPITALRLRLGDTKDIPFLDDIVYEQALTEKKGDLKAATLLCGQYILAQLAFKTRQKLALIEVYGSDAFKQYKEYLLLVLKNPDFSGISPLPFTQLSCPSPIARFQKNWDKQYDCSIYAGCCDPDPCGVNPL